MRYRLLAAFVLLPLAAAAQGPVGLLSSVSGKVQIVRAGLTDPAPARPADLLLAGDRVVTSGDAQATFLFCPQSRAAKILPGSEIEFAAGSFTVKKGKVAEERAVPSCRLPKTLVLASASQVQSGQLRLRGSNLLLRSPSRANTATLRPLFRWEPVDTARAYDLKVLDREERILWRTSGTATEVQYPADAAPLAWGQKYWWRVTARDSQDTLMEVGTYFQILPAEQAEEVRSAETGLRRLIAENPSDSVPRFLLAFLYEERGMLDEAVRLYQELGSQTGSQPWVEVRLNELMNKLGWDRP